MPKPLADRMRAGLKEIYVACTLTPDEEDEVARLMHEGRNVPPPEAVISRWQTISSTAARLLRLLGEEDNP